MSEPVDAESQARSREWATNYRRRLIVTDALVILLAVAGSQVLWFGLDRSQLQIGHDENMLRLSYIIVTAILVLSWLVSLAAFDTRDIRYVGIGATEYKRVFDASLRLFGLVAIVALVFKVDLARGFILTAFPAGVVLLVGCRWLWRQWLVRERLEGRYSSRTLLVGTVESIGSVAEQFERFPYAGFRAIGMCVPSAAAKKGQAEVSGIPVLGTIDEVAEVARASGADCVILTSTDALPPRMVRRISWSLETSGVDLAIAPALTDIAGPRIHTRPLAGLPLLHVEVPKYEGGAQWAKAAFDFITALVAVVLLSPLLIVIALLIKLTSRGPVFFRQERVGLNGAPFRMLKFRTMVANAEELLPELVAHNEGRGLLFKLKDDPRITPLGRALRRFSLDELPQFFNVLRGSMSVVGPRPPLPSEVAKYEPEVRRRLLVKPGVTGPWQISGRSDLSWEDGVRLDLYYVENWTLMGDLVLIWRTIKAVFTQRGAY
jgi:exopolysaccharide biosynthesis polyprenyl glycosylphosphotransferase